ncbi:type 1 glutamine amidotransferase [Prauserella halophila]|uniref:Type 1 glutamine amidotransferase n=1 Tax=Prauserella halophila TaxID=185641 RepID=A0ABN1W0E8_9PSEU|nr:type 1 glutamine amidotransferase [Prauserella halophila]MCP2235399.1 GMP synthase - Glutamine amidotransferase [Prauserella halophila]
MSTQILVVQPDDNVPAGALGEWLEEAGAELDVRLAGTDEVPATVDGYDAVVCLGGGMNAFADEAYPWLSTVRRLLSTAVGGGVATLGVCLGGQLLAAATGGVVRAGAHGPEAGPKLVSKKDAAWTDPLFAELPLMPDVLEFHRDAIEMLPGEATLLASTPLYPHQAFRIGRRAYGLQFHIETTPDIVDTWVARSPDVAGVAKPGAFDAETLDRVHADIDETWRPFAHRFVALAAGTVRPADDPRRGLPLA